MKYSTCTHKNAQYIMLHFIHCPVYLTLPLVEMFSSQHQTQC